MSMEIDSSQPGIQLNNEDRAQHQFNYSCSSWNREPEINPPTRFLRDVIDDL